MASKVRAAPRRALPVVNQQLYISRNLLHCSEDDRTIVLALNRARYVMLDGVASTVWRALTAQLSDDGVVDLNAALHLADARVIEECRDQFISNGLLQVGETMIVTRLRIAKLRLLGALFAATSLLPPSRVGCVARLAVMDVALHLCGYITVHEALAGKRRAIPAPCDPEALAVAVDRAAAIYPFRAKCLERSLVLMGLLGESGVAAVVALGVSHYPFRAHAWIEHLDKPLNCPVEIVGIFRRLAPVV